MSEQEVNEAAAMYWEHGTGSQIECDGKGQLTGFVRVPCVLHDAVTTVADAYIAEHPADDGDAVTEEWLLGCGFLPAAWCRPKRDGDAGRSGSYSLGDLHLLFVIDCLDEPGFWCLGGINTAPLPTRGHVRRFCAAIGITLTEGAFP